MVTLIASLHTTDSLLLDLYYAGAINHLKMRLRGAWQCEAVVALRPSGKSLSAEIWLLLASWHVALRKFVASTMKTCLLTTCALRLRLRLRLWLIVAVLRIGLGGLRIRLMLRVGLRIGLRRDGPRNVEAVVVEVVGTEVSCLHRVDLQERGQAGGWGSYIAVTGRGRDVWAHALVLTLAATYAKELN